MSPRTMRNLAFTLAVLILAGGTVSLAEVSTDQSSERRVTTLLMDLRNDVNGMTDGADPIPNVRWDPYRRLPEPRVLNRTGAIREDGRPDVGFFPQSFIPVVVWAFNHQTDHDIAIAVWTPTGWSDTAFLTHDRELDEVDPRVFVDRNAGVHVVWAVEGEDPHVKYMYRNNEGTWRPAARVTPPGEIARRPSVAILGSSLVVAYERHFAIDPGSSHQGIVVRRLTEMSNGDGSVGEFDVNHVFPVPREGDLQPILHVRGGNVWLDWKHTDAHLGWVSFVDQQWTHVRLYPMLDPSWVGEENARQAIENLVISPRPPSSDPFQ